MHSNGSIYLSLLGSLAPYKSPHQLIADGYALYKRTHGGKDRALNGAIFEFLLCESLAREGIVPFYYQASLVQVPDVRFDILLYHPRQPVVLSAKTSMRERYKQADLEGRALQQVYREAESHLVTLDTKECNRVQGKINNRDVMGLTSCILANTSDYDDLLKALKGMKFKPGKSFKPLKQGILVP